MTLQGLASVTIGVPDVDATARFYADFGLAALGDARFATSDEGEQLRLVPAPVRTLVEVAVASDAALDLTVIGRRLGSLGVYTTLDEDLRAVDPASGTRFAVLASPERREHADDHTEAAVARRGPVPVRKLSHVVFGSPDAAASERFLVEGMGFRVSERIPGIGAFLRCSSDHHNVLVQQAPVTFLHHTAWLVDDLDDVARAGAHMVERDPASHVWGPGRHHVGSNHFWYLRDPAGNFAEYAAGLDVIEEDEALHPAELADRKALVAWAPPCPRSFAMPEDLAEAAG